MSEHGKSNLSKNNKNRKKKDMDIRSVASKFLGTVTKQEFKEITIKKLTELIGKKEMTDSVMAEIDRSVKNFFSSGVQVRKKEDAEWLANSIRADLELDKMRKALADPNQRAKLSPEESIIIQNARMPTDAIFVRRSNKPFDLVYSTSNATGWLPLQAISKINWTRREVAEMTNYADMVMAGDWSGVRDTDQEQIWAIFNRFVLGEKGQHKPAPQKRTYTISTKELLKYAEKE